MAFVKEVIELLKSADIGAIESYFARNPEELDAEIFLEMGPLQYACSEGYLELAERLLDMGADINQRGERDKQAAINAACGDAHVQIVEMLVDRGCELDTSSSLTNPLFSCAASMLNRYAPAFEKAGRTPEENSALLNRCAKILIKAGIDLSASYTTKTMVDMDAAAFANMYGHPQISATIIEALYPDSPRFQAAAWAETLEVSMGNAYSREKFRRWRYPPTRGKNKDWRPPPGECWQAPGT